MKRAFDYAVVGCGGIGSGALYWLARTAGAEVLGLEQFALGHHNGASQDHSRIIRYTYHSPEYVALAAACYAAWREVEEESGVRLIVQAGGLDIEAPGVRGPKDLDHCADALRAHDVPFESLTPDEAMRRWPQFRLPDGARALYQADGGLVDARRANAAHVALARARGATVAEQTRVLALAPQGDTVRIETSTGAYSARRVVVTADAWTNQVLAGLDVCWPLTVTQEQVTYFVTPNLRQFAPDRFPVWIWRAPQSFYGFPVYGEVATKAGQDVGGEVVTPETRTFEPNPAAHARLRGFLEQRIPGFLGPELYTKTCLYTMPPDRQFILDRLPEHPQVAVCVGAGHAFKFASLFGRILRDLAVDDRTDEPIDRFAIDRPTLTDPNYPPMFANTALLAEAAHPV